MSSLEEQNHEQAIAMHQQAVDERRSLVITTQVVLDDDGQPQLVTTRCHSDSAQADSSHILIAQAGAQSSTPAALALSLPEEISSVPDIGHVDVADPAEHSPRLDAAPTPAPTEQSGLREVASSGVSFTVIEHHDGKLPVHPEQRRPASIQLTVFPQQSPSPSDDRLFEAPVKSPRREQDEQKSTVRSAWKTSAFSTVDDSGGVAYRQHDEQGQRHLPQQVSFATSPGQLLLEAHNLSYSIGDKTLVNQVTLSLQAGEILAIVGPNGAGKTTLLKLLSGDLKPNTGDVLLGGMPLEHVGAREQAKKRSVMRQNVMMSFPFSSLEVVLMGRHPHLGPRGETAEDIALARDSLERTEALLFEQRIFTTLSGGEQARVTLARAIAQTTPVMLLDEPTAALDLRHQHGTLRLAREHARAGGAVLAILHDLNLAASYADRIGVISQGELVALGTPWEVLEASRLEEVYRVPIVIETHPLLAAPFVLVMPDV
jgi:iron complex transport system ATP-binding protein